MAEPIRREGFTAIMDNGDSQLAKSTLTSPSSTDMFLFFIRA